MANTSEKLLAAVERLNSRLESPTAPLTSVRTPETNSQGASTSLSSETTLELMAQALLKVINKESLPGGCLHPNEEEKDKWKTRMFHTWEEVVANTMLDIQEAVSLTIDNNIPIIQEEVRNEIRDSSSALRKLISAPAREFSGEIAMAINTLLSPKFDTMANLIKRIAILAETTTTSPPDSALGAPNSETTPVYKVLTSILLAVRETQYQMSKGYELINSMFHDMQTAIAREYRKEAEKEAEIRGYFRNLNTLKKAFLLELPSGVKKTPIDSVLEYMEIMDALQVQLQAHFTDHEVLKPVDEGPSVNTEKMLEKQCDKPVEVVQFKTKGKEEEAPKRNNECAAGELLTSELDEDVPKRKDPPEEQTIEAQCAAIAGYTEDTIDDEEEEQIELAKALSVLDQLPEGKPPALSGEELEKQKLLAKEQESLERELKQQALKNLEEQLNQVEKEFSNANLTSKEIVEEEEVPGTPEQEKNPMIVTPRESTKIRGEIICNDEREVSNLTAPSAVLAEASSDISHPSEESTVTSEAEQTEMQLSLASASVTRAMPPRSCKKTKSTQ
jgi:hypothetical protein